MAEARLLISSRNYSSWSLRGYLLCRMAGLTFTVETAPADDPQARAELLSRSSTFRLPCLVRGPVKIWDSLAIAEQLNEEFPEAHLLPEGRVARAHCRSIAGEMHGGFTALRASLPLNMRARRPGFRVWSGPAADIRPIQDIWEDALARSGGPWLFGARPSIADAMYAPVASRFLTYGVTLSGPAAAYQEKLLAWAPMVEWMVEAEREPEALAEIEGDF